MNRIVTTLFAIALCSILAAQTLEITDFQRVDNDMTARVNAPRMDNYGKPMALLKIATALTGVSVTGTGFCEVEAHTGEVWVYVNDGTFNIKIAVEGYERLVYNLPETAKSSTVYRMKLRGDNPLEQISVMFTTDPSGAEIIIDDRSIGKTQNGRLGATIGSGKHALKIVLDGFETVEDDLDIRVGNQGFDYRLDPAMDAAVTIESDPAGATVYVKNVKFGETPVSGFFPEGTYDIRIEKISYRTIEEKITITDPTTRRYTLTDVRSILTINTHPNATVYLNDDEGHKGGVSNLKLEPQMLNVRIEMPKAETITRQILLEEQQQVTKDLYPEVQTGTITVNVIPADANVEITGDSGEHYSSTGKGVFRDVPVGKYELRITASDYKTHMESFKLALDETVKKQVALTLEKDRAGEETPTTIHSEMLKTLPVSSNRDSSFNPKHLDVEFFFSMEFGGESEFSDGYHAESENTYTIASELHFPVIKKKTVAFLLGGGFGIQAPRHLIKKGEELTASFVPLYISTRFGYDLSRIFRHEVIVHLGYNLIIIDDDIAQDKAGLYFGFGTGINTEIGVMAEILYLEHHANLLYTHIKQTEWSFRLGYRLGI